MKRPSRDEPRPLAVNKRRDLLMGGSKTRAAAWFTFGRRIEFRLRGISHDRRNFLNKTAIALAADSATTVTYWDKNEPKTRYFKGANKVFNISAVNPVGVMTFASASLNGVPCELIIKAYRVHLKKNYPGGRCSTN